MKHSQVLRVNIKLAADDHWATAVNVVQKCPDFLIYRSIVLVQRQVLLDAFSDFAVSSQLEKEQLIVTNRARRKNAYVRIWTHARENVIVCLVADKCLPLLEPAATDHEEHFV